MSKPADTNLNAFTAESDALTGKPNAANAGGKWIRPAKRLAIYLRDGMACAYCGATVEGGASLSLDHLLPQSRGGSNGEGNLITCCGRCNSRRGNMDLSAWLDVACGDDARRVSALIVEHTAKDLRPFKAEAKALIARRVK